MSALRGFLAAVCTPRNRMLSVPPVCLGLESRTAGEAIVLSQLAKCFLQTLPCSTLGGNFGSSLLHAFLNVSNVKKITLLSHSPAPFPFLLRVSLWRPGWPPWCRGNYLAPVSKELVLQVWAVAHISGKCFLLFVEYIHSVANAFDCLLDILLDSTNYPGEQDVNDKRWHVSLPGVWYQVIPQSFCALVSHTESEAVTTVYLINLLWRLNTLKKSYSSPWHRVFSNSCCQRVSFSCWKI